MPQSLACLYVHIIFSTKDRMPLIDADLGPRLYSYVGGVLREHGSRLIEAGGMPDHVHLLVSLSREMGVAELVRLSKANSSKWVHETFPERSAFAWQAGYGAFTVSQSAVDDVRRYIADQARHHAKRTFQDEYRAVLRKHGIEYDERYVWG